MRMIRRMVWRIGWRFRRRTEYAAMRTDGKYWAGPHRWQGRTFTAHRPFVYRWGTKTACQAAINGNGLTGHVTPVKWKRN